MEKVARDPLKPHLRDSSLFAQNLPGNIKSKDVRHILKDFAVLRIQIISSKELNGGNWRWRQTRRGKGGTKAAQVEFASVAVAEKALAVLNLRLIPNSEPPTLLMLSPSRDQSPLSPTFSGSPRLVKCLPSHYTDLQLYMLIRPFGPLAFARVENTLGGIVQFWNEGTARAAEVAVRSAFAQTWKITLQVYNPCNVFFSNACPDADETSSKPPSELFGSITSDRMAHDNKGQSRGRGFVALKSPGKASNTTHVLPGKPLGSKSSVLNHYEPKVLSKLATQPMPSKAAGSGTTDEPTSNEYQTSRWNGSEKSSNTTVDSSHISQAVCEELYGEKQRLNEEEQQHEGSLHAQSEEWCEKLTITDSRLKIVELESDCPMWEEAKRMWEMKEKEEAERAEKAKRKAELLESQRKMRELHEQEKQWMLEEKASKAREEAERKARERKIAEEKERARLKEVARLNRWKAATQAERKRCRTRDVKLRGNAARWTKHHGLQRVIIVVDEFTQANFTEGLPLTFENISWPLLKDPMVFVIDDITWGNVEAFFAFAKTRARRVEKYNQFVETIHRLFHPDRWRARRALESVMDANLREKLEKAGNIVSQAVTPLWRETKNKR